MVTAEQRAIEAAAQAADVAAARAMQDAHGEAPVPALTRAWDALGTVPDPEIPPVSIVELGIVRDVRFEGGSLVVVVTPTYSGCPATELIQASIVEALSAAGFANARVVTQLAPAWTTDWIAPEGRRKLAAFGIAPPATLSQGPVPIDVAGISPLRRGAVAIACPRCASTRTRLVAQFGSTACKALYRCEACLEPFDYFKPH